MARPAPADRSSVRRVTAARYFDLVREGAIRSDDRVELLEGVIVAMSPRNPRHAAGVQWATEALFRAVGSRAVVRVQLPLVAGRHSVPEPDVAVVPGSRSDYVDAHPATALLVVEVADVTLIQDRLTKAAIYAAAGVPEYWLVNLRDDHVEVFRSPAVAAGRYEEKTVVRRGDRLGIAALGGVNVVVDDLLPSRSV
jgi:Uma2 family endonuclease